MFSPLFLTRRLPAFLLILCFSSSVWASEPLRIAAAADLRFAMEEILVAFEQDHPGHQLEVIYGSSGRFRTQIAHGAPFDLYFSADIAYPEALAQGGYAASEVIPYGIGRLVIWSNSVDASTLTLRDLRRSEFRRIAIANPRHAPYGARAEEALRAESVWDGLEGRLVFAENIAHTLQLVQSGAANVGIIALSLALNPRVLEQGNYHLIDDALHQPLQQGFIITRRAADNPAAALFAAYMRAPTARAILQRFGFGLPDHRESS